ncbi:MAG: hypothetical protein IPK15_07280 [Verrucomicrobia bacterium]|nr:hypothetical protein [Verrucomicrobiota bacterium]
MIKSLSGGILKVSIPAPAAAYPNTALDLYLADTAALAKNNFYPAAMIHPGAFLGTYTDNGPLDTDPAANELSIDVSAFGITDSTVLTAAASYSSVAGNFNAINAVTTPMASPFSANPVLSIKVDAVAFTTELSWLGAPNLFDLQINNNVEDSGNWSPLPAGSVAHTGGRNIVTTGFENFDGATFYRLISK